MYLLNLLNIDVVSAASVICMTMVVVKYISFVSVYVIKTIEGGPYMQLQ
jgi:hypothetical protein